MRKGYILSRKEAADIFLILSKARFRLNGKYQTSAQKYWEKLECALDLVPEDPK